MPNLGLCPPDRLIWQRSFTPGLRWEVRARFFRQLWSLDWSWESGEHEGKGGLVSRALRSHVLWLIVGYLGILVLMAKANT